MRRALATLVALLGFLAAPAVADRDAPAAIEGPHIHLVALKDGLVSAAPGRDLAKLHDEGMGKIAKGLGIDLTEVDDPFVAFQYKAGRLFYVFYKNISGPAGDRPWAIQRIKRTEKNWRSLDEEPEVTTTYMVEVFKLQYGKLKRPDQHYGKYSIREFAKREIIKECEIGFGEIGEALKGSAWPLPANKLYKQVLPYGTDRAMYNEVAFTRATTWRLDVTLDEEGNASVKVPELGLDLPDTIPDVDAARPWQNPDSKDLVLEPGEGVGTVRIGGEGKDLTTAAWGAPRYVIRHSSGKRNLIFGNGLTVNTGANGAITTIIARMSFAGTVGEDVRIGCTRAHLLGALGTPSQTLRSGALKYPGVIYTFDALDRLRQAVVFAGR